MNSKRKNQVSTQFESFEKTKKATARNAVLKALGHEPLTRAEISTATGLRLSSVCGRANELIALGRIVVMGTKFDATTRRNVEILGLKEAA